MVDIYSVARSLWQLTIDGTAIAQTIKDPNVLGNWQTAFDHFIQSGQVWVLLIGLILGYIIRGLTTYG